MKRAFLLIICAITPCLMCLSDVEAQEVLNDSDAKAFVQKFYDNYTVLYSAPHDKKHPECSCTIILKQHPEYFEPMLLKALLDDYNAQAKVQGEIVGLDFDPYLASQDDGFKYEAGSVKPVKNKLLIEIHVAENTQSKKKVLAGAIAVIAEVIKLNGHWVFTNFIYPAEGKHKQSDLRQILVDLRKDRAKYAK